MNRSKWFIRSEDIFSIKNLFLLNITSEILNDIETDENKNYWKYRSFEYIREILQKKYRISQHAFVVLYTREKLMMAARFAWMLYWIGYKQIRILIGEINPSLLIIKLSQSIIVPNAPLRPEVRLTCDELIPRGTKCIDVRTYREYSGELTGYSYVRRAGHIPDFIFDPLDGIYGDINGDITWNELEEYLRLMLRSNTDNKGTERIVYMCGTGWRASLAAIFAEELNLAKIIIVLDSGWFEWSERFCFSKCVD